MLIANSPLFHFLPYTLDYTQAVLIARGLQTEKWFIYWTYAINISLFLRKANFSYNHEYDKEVLLWSSPKYWRKNWDKFDFV